MGMRIKLHSSEHPNNLLKELNKCRLSETMCDVTILVGNRSFTAHKAVLACAAKYFQNLFMNGGMESTRTYVVDFITPANFDKILNFVYTSELFTDLINVGVIYEMAERLGMCDLLKACHSTFPDLESSAATKLSSAPHEAPANSVGPTTEQNQPTGEIRNSTVFFNPEKNYIMKVEVGTDYKGHEKNVGEEATRTMPVLYPQTTKSEAQGTLTQYSQMTSTASVSSQPSLSSSNMVQTSGSSCQQYKIESNGHYNQASFFMGDTALDDTAGSNSCPSNSESSKDQGFGQMDELRLEELGEGDLHFDDPSEDMVPAEEVIELSDDSEEDLGYSENGHGGNKAMPCQVCKKVLEPNIQLIRHHARDHVDPKTGNCSICKAHFQDRNSRVTHVLSHIGIFLFSCDMCETKFFTQWQLTLHRREKVCANNILVQPNDVLSRDINLVNGTSDSELTCAACGKTFTRDFQVLREHILDHLNLKCLICCVCDQSHRTLCSLMWHTLSHMGITVFSCSSCANSFVDKDLLEKHMVIHKGIECYLFKCQLCPQIFRSEDALHQHMSQRKCGSVDGMLSLAEHQQRLQKRKLTEDSLIEDGSQPSQATNSRWYNCKVCGKRFAHSSEFSYHTRIHTGEKPYQCKVCHRFFRGRSTIKCHLKTHAGALMYRCTVCGHYSPTLNIMTKHIEVHKGNLPPDFTIEQTFMYTIHSKESEKPPES
ncbi:zinc finger and BTB domain-containing protein 39 [Protopterus annectens]|uniref:zinc finger and BTB domain-containing protein 39 n=1 Tax=Protopterus annectens TaxID=7888 RepID=UPI001CFA2DA0|nr:zinc finger and BTB domain-containing protein 39 [Protopterus annectens]XP_043939583.1 zinc finger and BTB domain-containing protein 39 [Protopterus annectens]XP_043939584.1 zinc finger and BTB domain-containing protein 39 [Protopterus annectens]